ncbi:MAG: hypothetical protein PWR20_835 [Bacteroidales bacterium]|jgi:hypothetical protein|nr:hypothetical protein [Bacteroidales bacterium]MDN5329558.1 hypothetical protein [Bacteroidales bacterium]
MAFPSKAQTYKNHYIKTGLNRNHLLFIFIQKKQELICKNPNIENNS